jgi:HK97 family phage major capsid protein
MVEGTDSAGGYLVAPEVSDQLVRLRTVATPLRSRFSSVSVTSDTLQISQQTSGLTAAWTDELATKTAADFTFGQISASVFTGAGLAVVSNQLLQDARPSIDGLITQDLSKRLAILEEKAFINGSGTGQPRGILNTSGINTSRSPTPTRPRPSRSCSRTS